MRDVAVAAVTFTALTKAIDYDTLTAPIGNGCSQPSTPSYTYSYVQ